MYLHDIHGTKRYALRPMRHFPSFLFLLFLFFASSGVDFHWYRLDDSGFWCHKPGRSRITPLDNNGTLITDPRKAAVKPYVFVAFMTTDRNNVTIK